MAADLFYGLFKHGQLRLFQMHSYIFCSRLVYERMEMNSSFPNEKFVSCSRQLCSVAELGGLNDAHVSVTSLSFSMMLRDVLAFSKIWNQLE